MKKIQTLLLLLSVGFTSLFAQESSDVLKKANDLINKNDLPKAISMLEEVVEKHKDIYEAYYLLGKAHYLRKDDEKAEKNFKKAMELNRLFTPPYLLLANIYDRKNKLDDAEEVLNRAIDVDAANGILYAKLGEINFRQGKEDLAMKAFVRSYQYDKTLSSSIREVARIQMKNREYLTAFDLLSKTLKELPPGSPEETSFKDLMKDCRYNMLIIEAERLFSLNRFSRALPLYQEALSLQSLDKDLVVKLASCYHAMKESSKAEELVASVLAENPQHGPAWRTKAVIANSKGDLPLAESSVLKAIEFDEGQASTYVLAGNIFEQMGAKDKARRYYGQAVVLDEGNAHARLRLGYLLADEGRYDESLRHLEAAQSLSPSQDKKDLLQTVKSYQQIELGNKAFDEKRYQDSIGYYEQSIKLKKSTVALINLANVQIETGKWDDAINILKGLTTEKEKFIPAFESLGIAYQKSGRTKEAESVYKQMQVVAKDDPVVYANTARYYLRNSDFPRAVTNFKKAIGFAKEPKLGDELKSELARTYYSQGVDFYNKSDYDPAVLAFTNALIVEPAFVDASSALMRIRYVRDRNRMNALLNQASSAFARKEYGTAIEAYRNVLEIDEENRSAKFNLAGSYYAMNNFKQAELLLKDYLNRYPDDAEAVFLLSQVYLDQNDLLNAKTLLSRSQEKGLENSRIAYYLGYLYEKEGNIKDAEQNYLRAIRLNPNDLDARVSLGNIYYKQGDFTKSQEQYENVLRISPNNDAAVYNLGFIYYKKDRLNESLVQFKKAEQLIPDYAPLYFNLARVNYYTGNLEEAIRYGEKANAGTQKENIVYKWGLANIYVRLFQNEKDQGKKEDFRNKSLSLCEECIYNPENMEISMLARGKIVEVRPDKKYLYKARYIVDQRYEPQIIENVLYTYIERDNEFVKSYKETGEVIWRTKIKGRLSGQYKVGLNLYAPIGNEVVLFDLMKGNEVGKFSTSVVDLIPCPEGLIVAESGGNFSYYKGIRKEWEINFGAQNAGTVQAFFIDQNLFLYGKTKIMALEMATGKKIWEMIPSSMTIQEVGGFKSYLTVSMVGDSPAKMELSALSVENGNSLWVYPLKSELALKPIQDYQSTTLVLKDATVLKLANDGKLVWMKKLPYTPISVVYQNSLLLISLKNDSLLALDPQSGEEIWKYSLEKDKLEQGALYTIYYAEK